MSIWWNSLSSFEQFFWMLAIPFSALFIIQMILLIIGIDHGGDISDINGDVNLDVNHELDIGDHSNIFLDSNVPLRLITLRNFIIFFTIFSWGGIAGIRNNYSRPMTLILGFSLASAVVVILTIVFRFILKLTESGNTNLKYAIGERGEVYLTIPDAGKKGGKIEVVFQSSLKEVEAITYGDKLVTGTKIIVIGVEENYLVVKELEEMNKEELLC